MNVLISIYPKPGIHTSVSYPFSPTNIQRFSDIARFVTKYTWSPIIFSNEMRREDNFLWSTLISLDFDNNEEQVMTLSQAVNNVFAGMRHIIGTTKSHQLPKDGFLPADRFRVILQLDHIITNPSDYRYTFNKSIAHYNSDSKAAGLSRLFHPCKEIISISDGYLEDFYQETDDAKRKRVAMVETRKKEAEAYRQLGKEPPYVKHLMKKVVSSHRNPTLYPVIRYYAELGMDTIQIEEIIKTSSTYIHNINDRQWIKGIVSSIKSAVKNHGVGNG